MKRLLLGIYPARWRERYGDELLALVDETGLAPRESSWTWRAAAFGSVSVPRDAQSRKEALRW